MPTQTASVDQQKQSNVTPSSRELVASANAKAAETIQALKTIEQNIGSMWTSFNGVSEPRSVEINNALTRIDGLKPLLATMKEQLTAVSGTIAQVKVVD